MMDCEDQITKVWGSFADLRKWRGCSASRQSTTRSIELLLEPLPIQILGRSKASKVLLPLPDPPSDTVGLQQTYRRNAICDLLVFQGLKGSRYEKSARKQRPYVTLRE